MIKHGTEKVWKTMRDDLTELVGMIDEIESVTGKERNETKQIYRVVNIWQASVKLPQTIMSVIGSDLFSWTDRAEWNNDTHICTWTIELHQFRESVKCNGTTTFEPAMGGNGTRVTFSGNIDWDNRKTGGMTGMLGEAFLVIGGDFIQNAVQKNFRKLAEATAKYLDKK